MMQTDDFVGQVVAALDAKGLSENTMVIVTSDNGCAFKADIPALKAQGHHPNGKFRGMKMELWDGGHRVPFIVKWPSVVKAGSVNHEIVCLNDLIATCSELVDVPLAANEGEDSVSFLPALKGEPIVTERKGIVHHSFSGKFAYREGKWKLILSKGSGGLRPGLTKEELAAAPKGQLYDMEVDPSETTNLYTKNPEKVKELLAQLETYVENGRSTPGENQKNDTSRIVLWKK